MKTLKKIYCSLDIETSGFDPLKEEVLEVGFAIFETGDLGFKILEEWTQVFKPSKPVAPQILGLTGISQKELGEAPRFEELKTFLQSKLGNAVIVGHNVIFDIKFLEANGLKFSGEIIDTLDLVQWILPTHHSYNLENLMHTFGISHKDAHRALADSKATISLLEKLLQVYRSFPEKLKKQIIALMETENFSWGDFLSVKFLGLTFDSFAETKRYGEMSLGTDFNLQSETIYNFGLDVSYMEALFSTLLKTRGKVLLVVPKSQQVLEILRQNKSQAAAFLPEFLFNDERLRSLLKRDDRSTEETKFLLKILVWQHTNWQTKTIVDLNLSFFGGQFKSLISGGELKENKTAKLIVCDQATFFYLAEHNMYAKHHAVICGMNEFEAGITANIGVKASWGYLNYLLKSYFNPELNSGQQKFQASVVDGLAASDLFFGLTSALLQSDPPVFQYYKINEETEFDEKYQKIKAAAENFLVKLNQANIELNSSDIKRFAENFQNFFLAEPNRVKWIELSENRCAFLSMPIEIKQLVKEVLKPFKKVSFADILGSEMLLKFFITRLGLEAFRVQMPKTKHKKNSEKGILGQGDLFSGVKKIFSSKMPTINYHIRPVNPLLDDLLGILGKDKSLPAAILFAGSQQLREFYEANFLTLKARGALLSQFSSGGSNKMFRNFSINPKSLLLCTDKFVLKALNHQSSVDQVERLAVKTLIICRLPFEQFSHPYQEAVSQSFPSAFMDYALPKALYNFHNLIKFFYGPLLKDIYVIDLKLSKDYSRVFKDYYQFLPGSEIK